MIGEWLTAQLDYILFLYGLAFIVLAYICWSLHKEDPSTLPWRWLALFGLAHGMGEWFEMLTLSVSDLPVVKAVEFGLMAASYVALVEFGRRGVTRHARPMVGQWLVLVLFGLAALGALTGNITGLKIAFRYALGFPGGCLAVVALWSVWRSTELNHLRKGLLLASATMLLYTVAMGLVVPRASFPPASWLNYDSFQSFTGIPIKLLRAFAALGLMTSLWWYGRARETETPRHEPLPRWLIPVIAGLIVGSGWYATDWRGRVVDAEQHEHFRHEAVDLAQTLNPDRVKVLSFTPTDLETPVYERLREQLTTLGNIHPNLRRVYLVAQRHDRFVTGLNVSFGDAVPVDPATAQNKSGDNLSVKLAASFNSMQSFVEGPHAGAYGTAASAYAPILDGRSGQSLAVVGIEIQADDWVSQVEAARLSIILGELVFLLLILSGLIAVRWRNCLPVARQQRLRHVETALIGVCGLTLTAALTLLIRDAESRDQKALFFHLSVLNVEQVREEFFTLRNELSILAHSYESRRDTGCAVVDAVAATAAQTTTIQAYDWIPRVKAEDRNRFEAEARHDGLANFAIWELNARREKVPVSGRAEYFPIYHVEPEAGNEVAIGFDEGSEPVRRAALEKAGRTGLPTATGAVIPVSGGVRRSTILVLHPVYSHRPAEPDSARTLTGFAAAVIRIQPLFEKAARSKGFDGDLVEMQLVDMSDSSGYRVVAICPQSDTSEHIGSVDQLAVQSQTLQSTQPIFAFGRAYALVTRPKVAFYTSQRMLGHIVAGVLGFFLTALLTLLVGFLYNRRAYLISEVDQRTKELRESEKFLKETQFVAGLGTYALNIVTDRWTSSDILDDIFGIGETFPRSTGGWTSLLHPEDRAMMVDYFMNEVLGKHTRFDKEYRIIRHKDGQERWIHGAGELEFDVHNRPVRMIGIIQDITERKRAEETLRLKEGLLNATLESTADGILVVGRDGRTTLWNAKFCEMWHIPLDVVQTRDDDRMLNLVLSQLEDPAAFLAKVKELYQSSEESSDLIKFADGRVFERYSCALITDGTATGRVWSFRDITERKRVEKERLELERRLLHAQKLESLGVLSGGIAHDFNNLLAAIMGNLDLAMEDTSVTSAAKPSVEKAMQAADRAALLCRQMLAYSGKGQFITTRINLNDVISGNAEMLRTLVSRNVTIDLQLGQIPPVIEGDAGQMQQIVMNFITNASEAIGDKSGVVTLSTGIMACDETYLNQSRLDEKPKPGQYAWLEVADTGCGMDAGTLERLFEPFFTTKFTGRGLGMSAVQGIIKGHNGALMVESWKGTGTRIRVLLPAAAECATAEKAVVGKATPSRHDQMIPTSGTILIVDDEEAVRNLCASVVTRLGFETLLAGDGVEAVQLLSSRPDRIVCVILDLTMPRMNGVETFEAMIDIKPDIKVILCSGYAEQQATLSFTRRSPAGFVHKPFRLAALRAELERVLRNGDSGGPVNRPRESQVPATHI